MNRLINAAWPYNRDGLSYQQSSPANGGNINVLQSYTQADSGIQLDLVNQTAKEFLHGSRRSRQYFLRLVIVTRSWTAGSGHTKVANYDINQEDLTAILTHQGLTSFYLQTRVDVAGVFTSSLSPGSHKNSQVRDYLAVIYDANLGLWATYDGEFKQWQGIYVIPDGTLDVKRITGELLGFARSKIFMYLLAAKFTIDFIGIKSGELHEQVAKIEQHSGHHFSVLRPVPSTYAKLEKMSADATGTANLVSYYKIVISHLAGELVRNLENAICDREDCTLRADAKRHAFNLRHRLGSLHKYMTYLEKRAERQITATQHLVASANASTNLAVAHDTRAVAVASKRDASSMKMLAAVTTTFLPGAFVATLFSMDMFDWFAGEGERVVSARFWVYWSVTVPLTLITVGTWLGWELWSGERGGEVRQGSVVEATEMDKRAV